VIEKYQLEADFEELVEIVKALDILGAERRLSEYEVVLYIKWYDLGENKKEFEIRYGERLPVTFFDHVKSFEYILYSEIVGMVGTVD
jgi:hypothetical protein